MPSRSNLEHRRNGPSYGAPLSTPAPSRNRDAERKKKLETRASPAERRRRIEEQEERGRQETRRRQAEDKPRERKRRDDDNPLIAERDTEGRPVGKGGAARRKKIDEMVEETQ